MSLSQKDKELIDKYAKKIVDKGLGTMALLWLDGTSHLSGVMSQLMHIASPTLSMVPYLNDFFKNADQIAEILEDRENIDYFLKRIEFFMNKKNKDKEEQKALARNNDGE